jgi:hypothetical protein
MKCIAILAGMLAFTPLVSASQVCVPGTLAAYIALGAGGCTIGTKTVSNFIALTGGATQLATASVNVSTSGGTSNPTLVFSVTQSPTANPGVETIFDYRISGNTYTNSALALSGSSETGNGAVTDLENICIGGTWDASGVTTCSTGISKTASLTTLDGIQNTDSKALTAAAFLSVTNDIELDGPATGAVGTDSFTATSATPEPASWCLFAMGLAVSAFFKIRVAAAGKGN